MSEVTNKSFSLADLNLTAKCEAAFEFEYLDSKGKGTGLFITVIGSQAPKVQAWLRKTINRQRTQDAVLTKRGKEEIRTVEDDEEFGAEAAVVRMVGWRGINEPFSPDAALELVTINALVRAQVFDASNDLSNFT